MTRQNTSRFVVFVERFSYAPALIYSALLAKGALRAHFANDDPMNMGWAWRDGLVVLARQCATFWSTAYRPMAQLFYETIYKVWGLNPLPYRIVILALVISNVYLSWRLAKLLTDSSAVAFLTSVLVTAHPKMVDLYYQNDIIYDVLAFFFSILTLNYYVGIRKTGRCLNLAESVAVICLFIAALDSKEISAPLAGFILAFEWMYGGGGPWWKHGGWFPWLLVLLDSIYTAGKILGPQSLTQIGPYSLHLSAGKYLETSLSFLRDLIYPLSWAGMKTLAAVDGALVILFFAARRSPAIRWSCIYVFISTLPVAFIGQRSGTALYLPLFGWALLLSSLSWLVMTKISRPFARRALYRGEAIKLVLLGVTAIGVIYVTTRDWDYWGRAYILDQESTWTSMSALEASPFRPRPGTTVLFIRDPYDDWRMFFIAELVWNDHSVEIKLAHTLPRPPSSRELSAYGSLLAFEGGELRVLTLREAAAEMNLAK